MDRGGRSAEIGAAVADDHRQVVAPSGPEIAPGRSRIGAV